MLKESLRFQQHIGPAAASLHAAVKPIFSPALTRATKCIVSVQGSECLHHSREDVPRYVTNSEHRSAEQCSSATILPPLEGVSQRVIEGKELERNRTQLLLSF